MLFLLYIHQLLTVYPYFLVGIDLCGATMLSCMYIGYLFLFRNGGFFRAYSMADSAQNNNYVWQPGSVGFAEGQRSLW